MNRYFWAALVTIVLIWPASALALPIQKHHEGCSDEQGMRRYLEADGERRVWTAHHSIGGLVEIWESYEGATWTILTTIAGKSCIRARGGTSTWEYPGWP